MVLQEVIQSFRLAGQGLGTAFSTILPAIKVAFSNLSPIFISALGFMSVIFEAVFGFGFPALSRLFLVAVITFALYTKVTQKIIGSPPIAFLASLVASVIALMILPDAWVSGLLTPYFAAIIVIAFLALTVLTRTVWWLRKALLVTLAVVLVSMWFFYKESDIYLVLAIVCLFFIILDNYIHLKLIKYRGKSELREKLKLKIKLKRKEITEAIKAGATQKEMDKIDKELKDLIKQEASS